MIQKKTDSKHEAKKILSLFRRDKDAEAEELAIDNEDYLDKALDNLQHSFDYMGACADDLSESNEFRRRIQEALSKTYKQLDAIRDMVREDK